MICNIGFAPFATIVAVGNGATVVTATKGSLIMNGVQKGDTWTIRVPSSGVWTVTAVKGDSVKSENVSIVDARAIYNLSFAWERVILGADGQLGAGITNVNPNQLIWNSTKQKWGLIRGGVPAHPVEPTIDGVILTGEKLTISGMETYKNLGFYVTIDHNTLPTPYDGSITGEQSMEVPEKYRDGQPHQLSFNIRQHEKTTYFSFMYN